VWYTQRADYRGMVGCVLGNGTVNEPESFTTYGMSTLIYEHPALDLPEMQPIDLAFTDDAANPVATVNRVGSASARAADRALCLPIQLTLLHDLNADLKAALIVQNELGWTIASADAVFATANQRTSAGAAVGDLLTAYPLLRLPYGAASGDYRVFLRLYDQTAALSGYNPIRAGQIISGRDALLTPWTALPGADWAEVNRVTEVPNERHLVISDDLTLLADNLTGGALANGEEIRAELLWQGTGALPSLQLVDEAGEWQIDVPTRLNQHDEITLDWRVLRVPPDAGDGAAVLRLADGTVLARYRVEALSMMTEVPAFATAVNVPFPGVGELVGYTLDQPQISREQASSVSLIWRAGDAVIPLGYTVTVQLIDESGQVIGQSDAIPGGRPTTGWRAGEYIVDPHTLTYNQTIPSGKARLIVGLYDAQTGDRVHLADGAEALTLMTGLEIQQRAGED
ncbi:MAG: hypothetical protein ABI835_11865, partial [Chloroflexota bacterium]